VSSGEPIRGNRGNCSPLRAVSSLYRGSSLVNVHGQRGPAHEDEPMPGYEWHQAVQHILPGDYTHWAVEPEVIHLQFLNARDDTNSDPN
jgi:hypothetical protein